MVLAGGGVAGRPPIDKRCWSRHIQDAARHLNGVTSVSCFSFLVVTTGA
jgi:hypothetical protein